MNKKPFRRNNILFSRINTCTHALHSMYLYCIRQSLFILFINFISTLFETTILYKVVQEHTRNNSYFRIVIIINTSSDFRLQIVWSNWKNSIRHIMGRPSLVSSTRRWFMMVFSEHNHQFSTRRSVFTKIDENPCRRVIYPSASAHCTFNYVPSGLHRIERVFVYSGASQDFNICWYLTVSLIERSPQTISNNAVLFTVDRSFTLPYVFIIYSMAQPWGGGVNGFNPPPHSPQYV